MKMVLKTVMLSVLLLIGKKEYAQQKEIQQIDSLLKKVNQYGIFNGNALVAKNDKIIYTVSIGYADASQKTKLTTDYRFSIGSIHKELSAVGLMLLKEQGKIKIDDRISTHLPAFPSWAKKIKISYLLNYTSGLPDVDINKLKDDKEAYDQLMKLDTLATEPGTTFSYNYNVIFLRQFIIEKITGIPFNTYAENYLLKPCSMKSSVMNPLISEKNIAISYSDDGVEFSTVRLLSGLLFTTTADLYKWTDYLHTKKLVNQESIFQMGQSVKNGISALGQAIYDNEVLVKHEHDGSSKCFQALLYSDLKEKITIILLTNTKGNKLQEIAKAIESIVKKEQYTIPKKSALNYLQKQLENLKTDNFIMRYTALKTAKGNELEFNEDDLNTIGYHFLTAGDVENAIKIFSLNVREFPSSANVYNSLGEALYTKKDMEHALINYKKCLELNPSDDATRKIIEQLEKP